MLSCLIETQRHAQAHSITTSRSMFFYPHDITDYSNSIHIQGKYIRQSTSTYTGVTEVGTTHSLKK